MKYFINRIFYGISKFINELQNVRLTVLRVTLMPFRLHMANL